MKRSGHGVSAAVLAAVYLFTILVSAEAHHHNEDVVGWRAVSVIADHADADHCRHVPLGAHTDCALCLSSTRKAAGVIASSAGLSLRLIGALICSVPDVRRHQFPFFSSSPRRAPPFLS